MFPDINALVIVCQMIYFGQILELANVPTCELAAEPSRPAEAPAERREATPDGRQAASSGREGQLEQT